MSASALALNRRECNRNVDNRSEGKWNSLMIRTILMCVCVFASEPCDCLQYAFPKWRRCQTCSEFGRIFKNITLDASYGCA